MLIITKQGCTIYTSVYRLMIMLKLLLEEKNLSLYRLEKESHIYTIKEDKLKENIENEESIFYIEIKFDEVKYKEYKKKFSEYELGHNSAEAFSHSESKDGDYEYDQIGLQSNEEGNVYPTYDNTIGIIQDEDNIKHMNVIK